MHMHLMEALAHDRLKEVSASASSASLAPLGRDVRRILHTVVGQLGRMRQLTWRHRVPLAPAGRAKPT